MRWHWTLLSFALVLLLRDYDTGSSFVAAMPPHDSVGSIGNHDQLHSLERVKRQEVVDEASGDDSGEAEASGDASGEAEASGETEAEEASGEVEAEEAFGEVESEEAEVEASGESEASGELEVVEESSGSEESEGESGSGEKEGAEEESSGEAELEEIVEEVIEAESVTDLSEEASEESEDEAELEEVDEFPETDATMEYDMSGNETLIEDFEENDNGTAIDVGEDLFAAVVEVEDVPECMNTTFQCCPDSEIAAHGPEGQGCCLSTEFGCCPDQLTAANDTELSNCGCETSAYGCCPDGVTSALDADGTSCGCQHTEHGCCPDQYNSATGPDFAGCPCHTYEYGCCPDGETVAQGPNLEGCTGCEATEHGCCPDGFTRAEGPYNFGCDCAGSANECCPDGVSEAMGPKLEGGEEANETTAEEVEFPGCGETPGQACHLDKDPGTCKENFTVRWFFDRDYGGCSRFWWSGCGGNANKFSDAKACENHCVKVPGSGRCYLPKVTGPCRGQLGKWYFDQQWQQCMNFQYGGCLGKKSCSM